MSLRIKIIYNNLGSAEGCNVAWGFSAIIELNGKIVLFDTGGDPDVLENNLRTMNYHPGSPDYIVISHEHWDHINGLKYLAGKPKTGYKLYIPKQASPNIPYLANFGSAVEVKGAIEIHEGIWVSGELEVPGQEGLTEQALILVNDDKLIIITGCSHPGIDKVVEHAMKLLPDKKVALVGGGFHMRDKSSEDILEIADRLKAMGVEKLAPSHCTGDLAISIFRNKWGENFVELFLGDEVVL